MVFPSPIPGPWPLALIGNLWDIDPKNSFRSMAELADIYGPIYKLRFGGEDRIVVTSYKRINEVCTRREFVKWPTGFLKQLRDIAGSGLFTAYPHEESWGIAHRTLSPAFGAVTVKNMLPSPENRIHVVEDFSRLTIDTLGLCAMDTRFNSFYTEGAPHYIQAMTALLGEIQLRSYRPWWMTSLMWEANRRFDANKDTLRSLAAAVIKQRRSLPRSEQDLIDAMLYGTDPKTGKPLSDDSIINNMITFLVAGHETTSGLLSFMLALILQHPQAYTKLQQEIDQVIGTKPITADHLKDLSYTKACIWESLRLQPPAAVFTVTCLEQDSSEKAPVILGGEWEVKPGQTVLIHVPKLHRDPAIWGDDANEFKPERMLDEKFSNLPKNCLKPFGNGQRACIGRAFALQEATVAIAVLFQNFNFELADPDYKISLDQKLAQKPHDFFMFAELRPHRDAISLQRDIFCGN
ncbi:cytochrome P450 [Xylariaceae sp. FL0594]|nr:cytochrome P450 [Xylariaceae sp. FL0594]